MQSKHRAEKRLLQLAESLTCAGKTRLTCSPTSSSVLSKVAHGNFAVFIFAGWGLFPAKSRKKQLPVGFAPELPSKMTLSRSYELFLAISRSS